MTQHLPLAALTLTIALSVTPHDADAARPAPGGALSTQLGSSAMKPPRSMARSVARSSAPLASSGSVSAGTPSRAAAGRWRRPVAPFEVLAAFAAPERRWLRGHRGIDLVTSVGQAVRAAGDGRVVFAGPIAGREVVSIDHGGLRTTYEPVNPVVRAGDVVRSGDRIGSLSTGSGHCGSGRCLHLGLRRDREYLDPLLLLGRTSARLRPW
jgi:murein DD-endopeptidase MepM/ murein hydrolase activator NlpD